MKKKLDKLLIGPGKWKDSALLQLLVEKTETKPPRQINTQLYIQLSCRIKFQGEQWNLMLAMVIEFKRKGTNVLAGACIVLAWLCFGYSKSSD